jgi:hypothetical protein
MVLDATFNTISTLVVICTDCIGSCESNYHTIMTTTAASQTSKSNLKRAQKQNKNTNGGFQKRLLELIFNQIDLSNSIIVII